MPYQINTNFYKTCTNTFDYDHWYLNGFTSTFENE